MTKCPYPGCTAKRVYYNFAGKKALYCSIKHIPNEYKGENCTNKMVNVVSKLCMNCYDKRPSFNLVGLLPIYCSPCGKKINQEQNINMINVTINHCEYPSCMVNPRFNEEGETKGKYCSSHIPKDKIMYNLQDKKCEHEECHKYATFNFEGLPGRYCKEHIIDKRMVNIKNYKQCHYPECKKRPSFGFSENKKIVDANLATHCANHKSKEMIDVIHPKCMECDLLASYNLRGEKIPLYCLAHIYGKLNYVNVLEPTCKTKECFTIVKHILKKKYEGFCFRCYMNIYPESEVTRNYKIKEIAVGDYLINLFPGDWKSDKVIGKSKKRPDLCLDLGHKIIIVEIDENKHLHYEDEQDRMLQISLDLGQRPIILIRFNPDNYKYKKENKKSCWEMVNFVTVLKEDYKTEWELRLKTLAKKVEFWLNPENNPTNQIEEIKLFYDDFVVDS